MHFHIIKIPIHPSSNAEDTSKYALNGSMRLTHHIHWPVFHVEAGCRGGFTGVITMESCEYARKNVKNVHIRWMIRRDIRAVLEINEESFDNPWCEEEFLRVFRQKNYIGIVATYNQIVAGFTIYEMQKSELDIITCAVGWEYRRSGVGRTMVEWVKRRLNHASRTVIKLHIPERNLEAQLFFSKQGFKALPVIKGLKRDTYEFLYTAPSTAAPTFPA